MRMGAMLLLMLVGVFAGNAFATEIDLNDGRVVQGSILKQDNKSIQVNVDGVTMTYYADEIKAVDGKSWKAVAVKPVTQVVAPAQVRVPAATLPQEPLPVASANAPVASANMDADKKALILKFIDVFGTRQALTNNFETMLQQIEKDKPDEAKKIRERVKVDEIIQRLLPIYDRNFTADDLKAFIAFYSSAVGQKLIGTIPELMKESVGESVKYMEEEFPEIKQGT